MCLINLYLNFVRINIRFSLILSYYFEIRESFIVCFLKGGNSNFFIEIFARVYVSNLKNTNNVRCAVYLFHTQ